MERLISMTDFVLEQDITDVKKRNSIVNYANFLKQKLELWMFVPCKLVEGVWVPIKGKENHFIRKELDEFREADKIVLFEGFEIDIFGYAYNGEIIIVFPSSDTIEDYVGYDLELTPTAKKQIGL